MRILVTGASGLLGLNMALEAAKSDGHKVFGQVYSHPLNTNAFNILQADLSDPGEVERIVDKVRPDWIINCAALAIVDACEADPAQAQKLNIELPEKLASYVARGGARLLHVSTDAVFDGQRGSYSEDDATNPLSVYGRTKLEGEHAVTSANSDAIISRVNFYGWSLSGKRSLSEFFFYNLQAGKQIMGFTDVYFCPLLVNDLALIFLDMLKMELSGLYHVVSSECISKYKFGTALARQFGFDQGLITPKSVTEGGLKAVRSPMLTLRTEKITEGLKKEPPGISAGLQKYADLSLTGYPKSLDEMSTNP